MDETPSNAIPEPAPRYRWKIDYSIVGDLKFISHHDTIRLFERAFARALFPVRFTEGFNPHPRMTIPLPRPVGIASQAESIIVETTADLELDAWRDRLDRHTPDDLSIRAIRRLALGEKPHPDWVRYQFAPRDALGSDIDEQIAAVLGTDTIEVERKKPGDTATKIVDIRPYIMEIRTDGTTIDFSLTISQRGTAKPGEIAGLLGHDPKTINHRIRRLFVHWRQTSDSVQETHASKDGEEKK